ncbi:hypothetical protein D210916BOD24_09590 [Alteromonas sp. D210916BOD_24]
MCSTALAGYRTSYKNYSGCNDSDANQTSCDSSLGESVYDLIDEGVYINTDAHYSSVSVDGVNISVSAWSDTVGTYNDDIVTSAYIADLGNYGYGVYNRDDESRGSSPDHAIDSVNTVHYNVDHDFDFVLLSFSEEVTLSGAAFSWVGNSNNTQVSIAGLNDINGLTSNTQTWSNIVENALTAGSYDIKNCNSIDIAQFDKNESAKYWLIGAYNAVFGQLNANMFDDAFKLASIGFSKPTPQDGPSPSTQVGEPQHIGILLAAGLIYARRRKAAR